MENIIIISLTFIGSVFLISDKFVNATNTPKFYFVAASLLVTTVYFSISRRYVNLGIIKSKTTHWCIFVICLLQACYGLFQLAGWLPIQHAGFVVSGSFDNPAGFAAVLTMGFPIGLFLMLKTKKIEKYMTIIIFMMDAIAVFLSGSRTGVLAIIISSVVFFIFMNNVLNKFQQYNYYKWLTGLIVVCFLVGVSLLYQQKRDSANGRLLIWKVSSEMIKDKPIMGHGYGAFQAKYMDYQADYFKNNPNSEYSQLADNVKHPFNEFIKIAVEFGILGLTVILSLMLFVLLKIIKSENENRGLIFCGLVSFLVFACFSYPLQYIAVWLLLAFYLALILPSKEIRIRNTPVLIIARIVVVAACTFSFSHFSKQIQAEIKWKAIAVNSLRGNTEKMLPEYKKLYSTSLKENPYFLYNYGAELNFAGKFDKSIDILTKCQQCFNDYDLQMLLADDHHKKGETKKAIEIYRHASFMIPCRFSPIYQLFEIYRKTGQKDMAVKYANEIVNKKVKIPSLTVNSIKAEAEEYLKVNEITFGNTRS